jgi:UDP-N-acetyl-2-amino-2-deoxyglucuronate dehydrogenase
MPKDIKFALLGFGQIGKKHAKLLSNCPDASLVAVIDSQATQIPEGFKVPFFNSLDHFFKTGGQADVVNVCTPNHLHAQHCLEVIQHDCHVLCEKPMGLHKTDCEKVINLSLQKNKSVFVVMQNRYSTTAEWLKSLLEENALGPICFVQANCFWNRDERYYAGSPWKGKSEMDGGVLFTQFSHFVDMLYWCFGDMKNFRSSFHNFSHQHLTEFEDTGAVSFEFVKGGLGTMQFSTSVWDKNMESSLTVIGQKGSLKIGGQYMEKVEYCHIKDYDTPSLGIKSVSHNKGEYTGNDAHHFLAIRNVVETLQGKSSISTNALEGMKVVEIIEQIYQSNL